MKSDYERADACGDDDERDYTRHDETPALTAEEWAQRQEYARAQWAAVHGGDDPAF